MRNDLVQSGLIIYLKSLSAITDELSDPLEIREDQWQGREFSYPNIRLRLISLKPTNSVDDCTQHTIELSCMVFSEESSSYQADRIAGIIHGALHAKAFSSEDLLYSLQTTNVIPSVRRDIRTWRSEVLLGGSVSSAS